MVQDCTLRSVPELFPRVTQWLAPAECLLCRETHNHRGFLCADCLRKLPRDENACQRCATPMSHSKLQIPGAPRRLAAPPAISAQRPASEYWRPFSCKERFGSSFIYDSFRVTPSLPSDGPPLRDHRSQCTATIYSAEPESTPNSGAHSHSVASTATAGF